jgi:4-hydroxy-tetrahydrodipicolinate reductase
MFYSKLVELASKMLNTKLGYDLEIIEAHHKHKKDAPSGTAMKLLDIASKNSEEHRRCYLWEKKAFMEKENQRNRNECNKSGDIVGEHTVLYSTDGERLELTTLKLIVEKPIQQVL